MFLIDKSNIKGMLNDVVNVKFLLLIVIIIFIFRHRKNCKNNHK